MTNEKNAVRLLGISFENLSEEDAKKRIKHLLSEKKGAKIFTPNPDMLWQASRSPQNKALLDAADLLLPDGVGVTLAARLCGTPLKARPAGIDTAEWLMEYAAKNGHSLYLLGGKAGVADQAAERLRERFPALRICGTHHGYFDHAAHSAENQAVLTDIRAKNPDILFVCFGFPLQERWIVENTRDLPSLSLAMGLGGSLDVWSGNLRRAPRPLRACGMEWLWRTLCEPRRIRTLLKIPPFLLTAVKQKQP